MNLVGLLCVGVPILVLLVFLGVGMFAESTAHGIGYILVLMFVFGAIITKED